jgi:tRNA A-37 threonylcarbamoyl transferase component Bud32
MIGHFNDIAQEVWDFVRCQRQDGSHYGTGGKCRKGQEVGYEEWNTHAKGNYGEIKINPKGTRVVKTLLTKDGKKGEFGPHEVEIATKMGKLGHSPQIHSSSEDHIEMDFVKGAPLWKDYSRGEGEPRMNTAQATKASAAIRALHKMGFAHGDLHSQQFIADGNNVKLVDFGLSVPVRQQPSRVMQDLAKIGPLLNWKNPELQSDPYVGLVNRYLDRYKEVKGQSKAAKETRTQIGEEYLKELNAL